MGSLLSPQQERFAEWLATPKTERQPATIQALAAEFGLNYTTVYRWRQNPIVKARAQQIIDECAIGPERIRALIDRIYDDALKGSTKDREMILKYAGLLVDRKSVEHINYDETDEMTEEEIMDELRESWDTEFTDIVSQEEWPEE